MRSFTDYIKQEMGLEMPKGNVPGDWFFENRIPMVVACSCCGMTMASPSAWIDDDGYTYCAECADLSRVIKGYTIEETGCLEFISNEHITETND